MSSVSDLDWEIHQMSIAIDYYERAREQTHSRKEADQFEKTIKKLNQQIKTLERDRDERY
tara:strand:- start:586 stop:765 length:180 start_codon:yes stop_codon:yes gene_type:complete